MWGVITGTPSIGVGVDIAGVPLLVYGFISGAPIALVAGLLGAVVVFALLQRRRWNPTWRGWLITCATCGILAAGGLAILLSTTGWMEAKAGVSLLFALIGPSGVLCGAILGLYGWRERQRTGVGDGST
jgi:hypothetical protein